MKNYLFLTLIIAASILTSSCVSRTTSSEKGYGADTTEKKIIWIWQDEYRKEK
jgi:hypothetical protein